MVILDTNVISEMSKASPSPDVKAWLDAQLFESLYITSITYAEQRFGIMILPKGKRRTLLDEAFKETTRLFHSRILPFDHEAAGYYAELAATARERGKGFPTPDGYIAAIARSRGFAVATRDTGPFEAAELDVINPWLASQ